MKAEIYLCDRYVFLFWQVSGGTISELLAALKVMSFTEAIEIIEKSQPSHSDASQEDDISAEISQEQGDCGMYIQRAAFWLL